MSWRVVRTIALKELRETLRDKRTLMAMVGIPLLLYPLILLVGTQAIVYRQGKVAAQTARVHVAEAVPDTVRDALANDARIELVDAPDADPPDALAAKILDAYLHVREPPRPAAPPEATAAQRGGTPRLTDTAPLPLNLTFDSTIPRSAAARARVQDALAAYADAEVERRLDTRGLTRDFINPLDLDATDAAPPRKRAGNLLGIGLPTLMILMLGLGAFYPAVDLTAGEKERGTFETLLSTPTAKREIVWGKFLCVVALSLATGLLNLGSMAVTLWFQLAQLRAAGGEGAGIGGLDLAALSVTPSDLGVILLVLVPLAVFISAVMMTLALLAREFKEASNYLSPFFLLIMLPALLVSVAGIELTGPVLLLPIANATLLFKNLLMSTATPLQVACVFGSTAVAAALALRVATAAFGREDLILSEERGLPLSLNRANFKPRRLPTPGLAVGIFFAALLLFVNLGSLLQAAALLPGLIASQWGILLVVPVAALWFFRVDLRASLLLRAPTLSSLLGATLMALGALVLGQQIGFWQSFVIDTPEAFNAGIAPLLTHPSLALVLFAVAVSPAVCEEVLFRGAVFSGLRSRLRPWTAILLTGLLFGVFHLYLHRILGTALLGIALTWLAWRTRSLWPCVLFHLLNNGISVLMIRNALPGNLITWLEQRNPAENGYPLWLVGASLALFVTGTLLIRSGRLALSEEDATPRRRDDRSAATDAAQGLDAPDR